ncbi:ABC transporter ATP-binding protein [Actinomyces urogenitalis]|uniref:ABC transporter ATP-binding protein n=1 Tax=Actinomyces urogenitalis TaxID=103621 RepID=UPI0006615273|nr:ATP-binding cassette domain-containing protein [Actinomyces urogenitalis]MDK8835979.1 ATP-binding cassette domain-containing protein [Actinomyces urogenitalis]MDU7427888.1 ATP-binding cassette domain-containing protein [Actinomyces urogenitalis]
MLQISHLSKRFGSLQALNELSFHVGDDELVGFVGANGAGKSTTMRIAMGVLEADSGTVTWDGQPVDAGLRRRIGYMPEERGLYPKMKVEAQLTYLARLHGVSKARAQEAALEWTERLGIQARRGDEVQKLSLGNQQRVQLAAALVADPALLILDEPFSGLDPVAVDVMSQVLRERAEAGIPTLFSSHQLDVVERLCDRIVIIRSGQLVAAGTIEELAATASPRWRVVIDDGAAAAGAPAATSQTEPSPLSPALAGLPQVEVSRDSHGRLIVTASGQDEQELLTAARPLGTVRELGPVRKPLTEIFREALTAPAVDGENPPRTEETTR